MRLSVAWLMIVCVCLNHLVSRGMGEKPEQHTFATMPSHQSALEGSTAVLPCRILHLDGVVQWTKDGFGLGTSRGLVDFERFTMIGSDEENDYSLRISPVTLEDDAEYQCQVVSLTNYHLRSQIAYLTVLTPPLPPTIEYESPAMVGTPVVLTCYSKGGKPASEVQWLDERGNPISKGVEYFKEEMEDKRFFAHSTLTLIPTKEDHEKKFTCLTHNPALTSPLTTEVILQVRYPPDIKLKFNPDELLEGEKASVTCIADANPSLVTYRWFRGSEEVPGAIGAVLPLGVVSRSDHATSVSCEVTNTIGTTRKTQSLNIKYPPKFKSTLDSVSAEPGVSVTLKCPVDANPPPKITWFKDSGEMTMYTGDELLVTTSSTSAGQYVCVVKSGGFEPLMGEISLLMKGPPNIQNETPILSVREGQSATLRCVIHSVPHPVAINWNKGKVLLAPDDGYHFEEEQTETGVISTLHINKTVQSDFTSFNCSAINEYGMDTQQIVLQRKPLIPILMVVAGGAGVIVVVFIVTLSIMCSRKTSTDVEKVQEGGTVVIDEKGVKALELKDCTGIMTVRSSVVDGGNSCSTSFPGNRGSKGSLDTSIKVTPKSPIPLDAQSTGQASDHKEADIQTTASLSTTERDSDSGWELGSSKTSPREVKTSVVHNRYSIVSANFMPMDPGYMSYGNYCGKYSPGRVSMADSYPQSLVEGPFARSTPASDPPSSLVSSEDTNQYLQKSPVPGANLNGRILPSANGTIPIGREVGCNGGGFISDGGESGGGSCGSGGEGGGGRENGGGSLALNGALKLALLQNLRDDLKKDLDCINTKYIISSPQTKIKPGTLV